MAHVRQAFNHVKPGGRLVAIMSNGFRFRQTSWDTGFQDLGKFELASDEFSIALALQQIAPYLRTGDPLPTSFTVPIIRQEPKPKLVASYGSTKVAEFTASRNRGRNRA